MEINIPVVNMPRVVIIGGGFGGIELVKVLRKLPVQTVLIDKNNYHTFQPLLYQVATAGLEPDSIAFPLRKIFKRYKNFYFRMAHVEHIRPENNTIITSIGEIHYDYLVVSTGSTTNFFGNQRFAESSMGMKSIVEALNIRSLILQNFEQALLRSDLKEREKLMSVAVVGGGPTGVEMAGALAELKRHILPADYPELDFRKMQIHIIEAGPRLLGSMSEESSAETIKFLTGMEVTVWLNTRVLDYDGEVLKTSIGKPIYTKTLIWAAGVAGNGLPGLNPMIVTRDKRFMVDEINRIKGYENIFAIGDIAAMITEDRPRGHPMVAPVAVQQARLLGRNLRNLLQKKPAVPFKYTDKGTMATVGRNKAVVDIHKFKTQGLLAWLIWMFVHLLLLVGFRNKLVVLVNWIWNYINYDTGIRLIIRPFRKKESEVKKAA
jgi:NADH:ubiquinone reductase (H+-translocating)